MKKLLTVLLALAIVFSMAIVVPAEELEVENFAKDAKWVKGHAQGSISEKNGVYTVTGISQPYHSPFINILPAVKAAIGTDSEAELAISFKIHVNFTEGNEGDFITARTLLRGGSVKADEADAWSEAYMEANDGEKFFYADPGGNIMKYLDGSIEATDDEWTPVLIELNVADYTVNCDMVTEWNFCFDTISNPSIIESIEIKDFAVTHFDESLTEIEGEDYEGAKKPAKDPADENDEPASDEPASDENFASKVTWEGFSGAQVTTAEDGTIVATNIIRGYSSPAVNVLPAIKKALGDNDSIEVFIVFDIRGIYKADYDGDDATASTLFRGNNGLKVAATEVDDWTDAYYDSFEDAEPLFKNSQGNIMYYLNKGVILESDWQTVVIPLELEGEQITNSAITKWTFCFDNMQNFEALESIEIKNFVVTLEEPETEGTEGETPGGNENADKPADNEPDPNATPTPYVVWATPIGYNSNQDTGNNGGNSSLPIIIACAAGAVVLVAGGILVAILATKKKASKED